MLYWVTASSVAALVVMLTYTVYYGRQTRHTGRRAFELSSHRDGSTLVLWLMIITIAVLEALIYQHPQPVRSALFWVHLPLAISFLSLFLALRFRYTGLRSKAHGRLAYLCAALFVATLGTGGILFWNFQL